MANPVLDAWRRKYPGAYDHISDADLAEAIVKKFPGAYDQKLQDVFENAPIITGDPAIDEPEAESAEPDEPGATTPAGPPRTPAGTRLPAVPTPTPGAAAAPPPFQVQRTPPPLPGFWETVQRGAKQIVQHGAGHPDYPTTGSQTLDLLVSPLRWTMSGLEKNIEAYKRGEGYGRPEDVTEMMTGAAMLGGLGRSPAAFRSGRWAKPSPPPGHPEFIGPLEVQGPPEVFGPAVPRGEQVKVGVVRKGPPPQAPTQSLLEAAKASQATPEVVPPTVPPQTRRYIEGTQTTGRPPVALVEADMGPLPLPGTQGPSASALPTTPRGQRARPIARRTPDLAQDLPAERVNPAEQAGTQSTLQAARDLATGRTLDLGEAGRRAAAARGRYAGEPGAEVPVVERPATETVVRRSPPPTVPGEPAAPAAAPGAPAAAPSAPAAAGAPQARGPALPDNYDDLQTLVRTRVEDMNRARPELSFGQRVRGRARELAPERMISIFRSGEPAARAYIDDATYHDMAWNAFVEGHSKAAAPTLRKIRTPEDRVMLATLSDSHVTPQQLLQQPQHIQDAYHFLRQDYTKLADQLGLPQSSRLADYYPHMFDVQDIRSTLQAAFDQAVATGDQAAVQQTEALLKQMPQPSIGAKSQVPDAVYAWMLQKRTGATGYSLDPIDVYKAYLRRAADKLHTEPVYKSYLANEGQITNPELRRLMARHAADFAGRGHETALEKADSYLRGGMYWTKLAGNITWPIWNVTLGQASNAAYFSAKGDPRAVVRGLGWLRTPEGRAVFNESGHTGVAGYHELSGSRGQIQAIGQRELMPESVKQWLLLRPDKVERLNRGGAFFGQLSHELEGKYGTDGFRQMLAKGIDEIPRDALIRAHRAVTETQGSYGARHDPAWLTLPGLRASAQFIGTGAKVTQGLLAKQGTSRLSRPIFLLPVYAEAIEEGLKHLGFDASRVAGVGIDISGLVTDAYDYHTNPQTPHTAGSILKSRIYDQWKEGRSGMFSYALGPIIPAVFERLPSAISAASNWVQGRPGAPDEFVRAASPEIVAANRALRAYRSSEYSNPLEVAGSFANIESERHRAFRRIIEGAERGLPGANAEMHDFTTRGKNVLSAEEKAAWRRALQEGQKLKAAKRQWERQQGIKTPEQRRMEQRPTTVRGAYEP